MFWGIETQKSYVFHYSVPWNRDATEDCFAEAVFNDVYWKDLSFAMHFVSWIAEILWTTMHHHWTPLDPFTITQYF